MTSRRNPAFLIQLVGSMFVVLLPALGLLIGDRGSCDDCPTDLDRNGAVDGSDLGLLLASWGVAR